jgi:hypothetical protein
MDVNMIKREYCREYERLFSTWIYLFLSCKIIAQATVKIDQGGR